MQIQEIAEGAFPEPDSGLSIRKWCHNCGADDCRCLQDSGPSSSNEGSGKSKKTLH